MAKKKVEKKVFVGVLAIIREHAKAGHLFRRFEWVPAAPTIGDDAYLDAGLFTKGKKNNSDWAEALEAVSGRTVCWNHPSEVVDKPVKGRINGVFLSMVCPVYFSSKSAKVLQVVQGLQDDLADDYNVAESLAAFFSGWRKDNPRLNDLFNELAEEISRIMMTVPILVPVGQSELQAIKAMQK